MFFGCFWLCLIVFDCFWLLLIVFKCFLMARPKDPALDGNHYISKSQYFACLPPFNLYIHTICSLWTIKATKVQHPTIYNTSRHTLPPNKIINLWTQKEIRKSPFWFETKGKLPFHSPLSTFSTRLKCVAHNINKHIRY